MQNPSWQQVISAVESGILTAQRAYQKGCDSLLCWGPEYLITTHIHQSLLGLPEIDGCLCLEERARELEDYCRNRLRGPKPKVVDGRSRCDLVLWHVNRNEPRSVIEVKRRAEGCSRDLKRLMRLVNQGLEFSVAASCLFERVRNDNEKDSKARLREVLNDLLRRMEQKTARSNQTVSLSRRSLRFYTARIGEVPSEEQWIWCPVCFVIHPKKNRR